MSQQNWNSDNSGAEGGDDDVQMPLGVGGEGGGAGEESYGGGESKPKVNNSTVALFAAFAAALIVLYLLGLQNKPRQASADELAKQQAVTSAIDEMLQHNDKGAKIGSLMEDTRQLVQLLMGALGGKAPEAAELPGNPFEHTSAPPPDLGKGPPPVPTDDPWLRDVAEDFSKLKLQMVMMGSRPAAMINNNLVTVGGKVGQYFTVTDIQPGKVLLTPGRKMGFTLNVEGGKTPQ